MVIEEAPQPSPPTRGWRYTFSSLADRDFRYLWLGMLFLMGAMQMQLLVRGYLTYELTSSPTKLAIVSAGFAPPMFCLTLFGGAIADRFERKRIIQAGQVAASLIALFIAVSASTDTVTWFHLLGASMFQGALFSFVMPARQALIPQLVGQERITNAMALDAMGISTMTMLAPAVAGGIYAVAGAEAAYYVISAMTLSSVLFTAMLPKQTGGPSRSRGAITKDIRAGLSYIRNSPIVMILLVMGLATALLAMPFRFLMPIFVVDIYQRGPEAMGLLVSLMGVGTLVGALFIAGLGRWRRGLMLLAGTFVSGVALMLLAVLPRYNVALGLMALLGVGDAGRRALNQALIMEVTEDQYRGRVMSVYMINFALMPLGVLPAGLAAELWGGQKAIGGLAVLLLATTTLILFTQKRLREQN